jgi:hypothetical protein
MPLDASFPLGPFIVTEAGELSPASQDTVPAFSVRWRERSVHIRMNHVGQRPDVSGALDLSVVLGRVPSTSGGDAVARQESRIRAFAAVRALKAALPDKWRLALLPDHRVALEAAAEIDLPATVAELVTEVTMFLLALDPYLDLVEEAGVIAPGPPAGMSNICPG